MENEYTEYTEPVRYTKPGEYPTSDQYKQRDVQFTQSQPVQQMPQPVQQMPQPVQQMAQPYQQMVQPVQTQVVFVKQPPHAAIPWVGVGVIVISLLLPYISIGGVFEVTGHEMIGIMGELAGELEDVDSDDGSSGDVSNDDAESDEIALAIALIMFAFSPLVFLLSAVVSVVILATGSSPRVIGNIHLTYVAIFVICGLLAPTSLGVSIFDFIGVGFYLGAMAGALLVF